jgi:hypothetical protein
MYSYSVFGGCLRSEIPFPELRSSESDAATWTFRVSNSPTVRGVAELLGSNIESDCQIELYREGDSLCLFHSCTGSFDIRSSGREINWSPASDVRIEAARADVFGRVLAIAMHLQGVMTLHASAVAFDTGAVAFLAPKHYGKSTLAMALTGAGARLVTDDMLTVRRNRTLTVAPGVQTLRLLGDSASRLALPGMSSHLGVDGKHVVKQADDDGLLTRDTSLAAIYILSPVTHLEHEASVQRSRLPASLAAISLVTHEKVGALLGRFGATKILDRASAVARAVPVYRLQIVRDMERLSDVAEEICGWHQLATLVDA